MKAGTPPALGSFVGLVTFPPLAKVIVWRLLHEEAFVVRQLAGTRLDIDLLRDWIARSQRVGARGTR